MNGLQWASSCSTLVRERPAQGTARMSKKKPEHPDEPPNESQEFYRALEQRKAIGERQRREERERVARELEPGLETKRALKMIALGTGALTASRIKVDDATLAKWIAGLGSAWARCPGMAVLAEQPLPDRGAGIEAGMRILSLACDGRSATDLEREIKLARVALGPRVDGDVTPSESEVGILVFFRQLDLFFDGRKWAPPRVRRPRTETSQLTQDDSREPQEANVAKARHGHCGQDGDRLQVPKLVWIEEPHLKRLRVGDSAQKQEWHVKWSSAAWAALTILKGSAFGEHLPIADLARKMDIVMDGLGRAGGHALADRSRGVLEGDELYESAQRVARSSGGLRDRYASLGPRDVVKRTRALLRGAITGPAGRQWRDRWIHWSPDGVEFGLRP